MIRFTTESGATYLVDTDDFKVMRLNGPYSRGIDYTTVADAEWDDWTAHNPIEVGKSVYFDLTYGRYRWTTPVAEIEELEAGD